MPPIPETVTAIVARVTGAPPPECHAAADFTDDLGLDSLDVVQIASEIETEFQIPEIDADTLAAATTVGALSEIVRVAVGAKGDAA